MQSVDLTLEMTHYVPRKILEQLEEDKYFMNIGVNVQTGKDVWFFEGVPLNCITKYRIIANRYNLQLDIENDWTIGI